MKTAATNQEVYKTEALLQFVLMHGDEEEAARLREKLMRLTGLDGVCQDCKPVWMSFAAARKLSTNSSLIFGKK